MTTVTVKSYWFTCTASVEIREDGGEYMVCLASNGDGAIKEGYGRYTTIAEAEAVAAKVLHR